MPVLKPFQKDTACGRVRANTGGSQLKFHRNRKRKEKLFYTGLVETVALTEQQNVTGKLERVDIALNAGMEAWGAKRLHRIWCIVN